MIFPCSFLNIPIVVGKTNTVMPCKWWANITQYSVWKWRQFSRLPTQVSRDWLTAILDLLCKYIGDVQGFL
jgi:hypothetical protein